MSETATTPAVTVRLWKCWNAHCADGPAPGFDFSNDSGKCPKCGVVFGDKIYPGVVDRRLCIHFEPPSGVVHGRGRGTLACDGQPRKQLNTKTKKWESRMATGAPSAVTCPACIESAEFAEAAAGESLDVHPDYAVPVTVNTKKGVIEGLPGPTSQGGCG